MPYYEQLIAALDTEPQVIEIEANIVDIDTNRLRDLGVSWRVTTEDGDEALFGEGNEGDLRLRPGEDITPAGEGLFLSTIIGNRDTFVSRIHALETEDAANVVSRPQVVTLNNVEAIIESNRSFYVRVAGEFDVDLFNVVAGTTLRVTPHVLREEGATPRIRLLVNVEDGSVTDARVDQIPVIDRSAINTQGLITEGESLLIGGLVRDESFSTTSRVPVLGRIPLLGRLFSRTSKSTSRIERLFLITPRLIPASRIAGGAGTSPTPAVVPVIPAPVPGSPGPAVVPPLTPSPGQSPSPGGAPTPQASPAPERAPSSGGAPPATPAPEREGV
jgi:type III secretion protein C